MLGSPFRSVRKKITAVNREEQATKRAQKIADVSLLLGSGPNGVFQPFSPVFRQCGGTGFVGCRIVTGAAQPPQLTRVASTEATKGQVDRHSKSGDPTDGAVQLLG